MVSVVSIGLFYRDEFYVEDECGIGWNAVACAIGSVGQIIRDEEAVLGAFGHQLYAFSPASDDLIETKDGRGSATVG